MAHQGEKGLRGRLKFGIKLGLERIKKMLELAGNPQERFKAIIVGGTNGKGSVSHMLAKVLSESGYKVGLYTSPHLVSYRERIRVDGMPISEHDFERLANWAEEIARRVERDEGLDAPTEFELLTLMACQYFCDECVDISVMEVGLGGRYDATNALSPMLSILTIVSLDHTDRLGRTHLEIANDKIGITRPDVPLVTAEHKFGVLEFIQSYCYLHRIPLRVVGKDVRWKKLWASYEGICGDYKTWRSIYPELKCSLGGDFQFSNLGCVVAAVELLRQMGMGITEERFRVGVGNVKCYGRLDVLHRNPFVVADGAHNPAAASSLSRALRTLFPYKRLGLVIGIMSDKDVYGILGALAPLADVIFATQAQTERAFKAHELARAASMWGKPVHVHDSVQRAYEAAREWAEDEDMVCVTGSIYVIGELPEYQHLALQPI
ncbi:MAG: folylpolyglutamate synthase/dihydrofolate synthase family protein [Armatimonadota bacterium]|nr:bifunctional folylpolyglutamate synthase/dihydrofolate synthase [Armatimonadota bacterium]MCX7777476.1 bifunctional folylpolyglutamate synthase/dihydrofolate synthase [Armatimonadota bacterium]MDW8025515.1 folylpolyglutamate synthase/dihydrofolate synthase family protein [Armatimonadota bacterium]